MNMNKRRLEVKTSAIGVGLTDTIMEQDQTDVANFHGMRFCGSIEPEVGLDVPGANSQ